MSLITTLSCIPASAFLAMFFPCVSVCFGASLTRPLSLESAVLHGLLRKTRRFSSDGSIGGALIGLFVNAFGQYLF
jgi:hypothetical protein